MRSLPNVEDVTYLCAGLIIGILFMLILIGRAIRKNRTQTILTFNGEQNVTGFKIYATKTNGDSTEIPHTLTKIRR